jgi:hypothetical protein
MPWREIGLEAICAKLGLRLAGTLVTDVAAETCAKYAAGVRGVAAATGPAAAIKRVLASRANFALNMK